MNNNLITGRKVTELKGNGGHAHRPCGSHIKPGKKAITIVTELEHGMPYTGKIHPFGFGCKDGDGNVICADCFHCTVSTKDCIAWNV